MENKNAKNVHAGHRIRVREKIKNGGLNNLHDHEILEYLLFHTVPYKDTNELAHRLIERFGSFHAVMDAEYDDLLQVKNVTEVTAVFLSSLPDVFKRYTDDLNKKIKIKNVDDVAKIMETKFIGESVENIYLLCLDGNMNLLSCVLIAKGNSMEVSADKRKIMEAVIRSNAENVILAHNHPNNNLNPSSDDLEAMTIIRAMLAEVGVRVLDSIIFADGRYKILTNNRFYAKR